MAGKIRDGFLDSVIAGMNAFMNEGDKWSALKAEFDTFTANGLALAQPDVNRVFGTHVEGTPPNETTVPNVTLAEVNQGITAMQTMVDFMHAPAQANKVYRLKR